jgi:hypothetical protein
MKKFKVILVAVGAGTLSLCLNLLVVWCLNFPPLIASILNPFLLLLLAVFSFFIMTMGFAIK